MMQSDMAMPSRIIMHHPDTAYQFVLNLTQCCAAVLLLSWAGVC